MIYAPYTAFGKTLSLPVVVYVDNKKTELTEWDEEMWVERGEDWYGLMSFPKTTRIRVVERHEWLIADRRAEQALAARHSR